MPLVDLGVRQREAGSYLGNKVGSPVHWVDRVLSFEDALLLPTHSEASALSSLATLVRRFRHPL